MPHNHIMQSVLLILGVALTAHVEATVAIEVTVLGEWTAVGMCPCAPTRVIDDGPTLAAFSDTLGIDPDELAEDPDFSVTQVITIAYPQSVSGVGHRISSVTKGSDTTTVSVTCSETTTPSGVSPQPGCRIQIVTIPRQQNPIVFTLATCVPTPGLTGSFPFDTAVMVEARAGSTIVSIERYGLELKYLHLRTDFTFTYYYVADIVGCREVGTDNWNVPERASHANLLNGRGCGVIMPPDTCPETSLSLNHPAIVYRLGVFGDTLVMRVVDIDFDTSQQVARSLTLEFNTEEGMHVRRASGQVSATRAEPTRSSWYDLLGRHSTDRAADFRPRVGASAEEGVRVRFWH